MTLDYHNPRHGPAQRSKTWLTGIGCAGGLLIVLIVLALITAPQLGRAREPANRVKCASNLRQIGQAAVLYAADHNGQLPPDLPTILRTQDFPAEIHMPNADAAHPAGAWQVGGMVSLDKLEETHIRKVLAAVPNLGEAANVLGIDQATLYRKRKKLNLQ